MGKATRAYRVWGPAEEQALRLGVTKHGLGAWETIRTDPDFSPLRSRSGVQLKDKWRNLLKFKHVTSDEVTRLHPKKAGPWSRPPAAKCERRRLSKRAKQTVYRLEDDSSDQLSCESDAITRTSHEMTHHCGEDVGQPEHADRSEPSHPLAVDFAEETEDTESKLFQSWHKVTRRLRSQRHKRASVSSLVSQVTDATHGIHLERVESSSITAANSLMMLTQGFQGRKFDGSADLPPQEQPDTLVPDGGMSRGQGLDPPVIPWAHVSSCASKHPFAHAAQMSDVEFIANNTSISAPEGSDMAEDGTWQPSAVFSPCTQDSEKAAHQLVALSVLPAYSHEYDMNGGGSPLNGPVFSDEEEEAPTIVCYPHTTSVKLEGTCVVNGPNADYVSDMRHAFMRATLPGHKDYPRTVSVQRTLQGSVWPSVTLLVQNPSEQPLPAPLPQATGGLSSFGRISDLNCTESTDILQDGAQGLFQTDADVLAARGAFQAEPGQFASDDWNMLLDPGATSVAAPQHPVLPSAAHGVDNALLAADAPCVAIPTWLGHATATDSPVCAVAGYREGTPELSLLHVPGSVTEACFSVPGQAGLDAGHFDTDCWDQKWNSIDAIQPVDVLYIDPSNETGSDEGQMFASAMEVSVVTHSSFQ